VEAARRGVIGLLQPHFRLKKNRYTIIFAIQILIAVIPGLICTLISKAILLPEWHLYNNVSRTSWVQAKSLHLPVW